MKITANDRTAKRIPKRDKALFYFSFFALLFVLSGIYGFIYETLDCRIDLGYFVKRGSTYGPWIPIYAFGGILIYLLSNRLKKHPAAVFLVNCIVTGSLEYITGYILLHTFGIRLWDYTYVHWNWLNVDGIICLRSVLFFGISGLILIYLLVPLIKHILTKENTKAAFCVSLVLLTAFISDIIIFQIHN